MAGTENDIVRVTDRRGVTLVHIRIDSILHDPEVEALGRALVAMAEVPGRRVVLSFLGVEQLTSRVLGQLIYARKRLNETGGELRLADIDPRLYEVFVISRLDRFFRIFEREDEAIASFHEEAEA
ncbi:MAG TPA: STAS domain-containing protein [Phycisphaerae bacterium]|nr:STAS domain-containing protein [Phycisphaerae bacterium]